MVKAAAWESLQAKSSQRAFVLYQALLQADSGGRLRDMPASRKHAGQVVSPSMRHHLHTDNGCLRAGADPIRFPPPDSSSHV